MAISPKKCSKTTATPEPTPQAQSFAQTVSPSTTAVFPVTGTGNPQLSLPEFDSTFAPVINVYQQTTIIGEGLVVDVDGRIRALSAGVARIFAHIDVAHTLAAATTAVRFGLLRSGVDTVLSAITYGKEPTPAGGIRNLCLSGILELQVGDIISVTLASDLTGSISILSSAITCDLVHS